MTRARISRNRLKKAIPGSGGVVAIVCKRTGYSWWSVRDAILADEELSRMMQDEAEMVNDFAELTIVEKIKGGDENSAKLWLARCPFHDDHHPSLWIDAERGICQCYVCHDKPLDVINLYAALNGISNEQAIRVLAKML